MTTTDPVMPRARRRGITVSARWKITAWIMLTTLLLLVVVLVTARNLSDGTITLSNPLFGGAGTRNYTFIRRRYAFDFSTIPQVDRFYFMNVEFGLEGNANGVMLPPSGSTTPSPRPASRTRS